MLLSVVNKAEVKSYFTTTKTFLRKVLIEICD